MVRWLKRIALSLFALVAVAGLVAWWLLRGSLPALDGEAALPGLSAPASIQRDALGVVTIDAASEADAMRALGYVHAQERYFEMDLMRRTAAGELAELFGPIALEADKQHRVHRMRARARDNLDAFAGDRLPQLHAYTEGVNAGLAALKARPWPYLLLRQQPEPWELADAALTGYAMYFDLQDSTNARELALWKMRPHLPPALYALLTRDGTRWDAPLMGEARGDAMLPTVDEVDLRKLPAPAVRAVAGAAGIASIARPEVGSNNFAVSGALTQDGRAIVADDMHLSLRAPNIWFRARLRYPDPRAPDGKVDVQGFTLPGLPAVIVGSNGHVAWGFTNSYGDWMDWVQLCPAKPGDADPACGKQFSPEDVSTLMEVIRVRGSGDIAYPVRETRMGPILHDLEDGSALALAWTAHSAQSINLQLLNWSRAADQGQLVKIAASTALPAQNLVIADHNGDIAWTIAGFIPSRRPSCHPDRPQPSHPPFDPPLPGGSPRPDDPCEVPRSGWMARNPVLHSPAVQRIWTANARVANGEWLRQIGDAGYALGARAGQIRGDLFAKRQFTERDLLAIQLDDRALFLAPWWQLLLDVAAGADSPALHALADAAKPWQGRASTQSVSYRIVRAWRLAVHARIADGLTAPAQAALGEAFEMPNLPQLEGAVWPLVTQRPSHLLPRRFTTWEALFEDAAREVRDGLARQGPLAARTWGERNTAAICHPLAKAIPLVGKRLLCMPPDRLAGDINMPRVAAPGFGASQRMVVSPGREADGIIHMPGGQSGHPLSPFWGAGHDDWVHGRPTPFLPRKSAHTLRLSPANRDL